MCIFVARIHARALARKINFDLKEKLQTIRCGGSAFGIIGR